MPNHEPNPLRATQGPASYADVDFAHLRARVVALENLVISMLGIGSDEQLDRARRMAAYISPRDGFTRHRVTIHAAQQIHRLVDRGVHFRSVDIGDSAATSLSLGEIEKKAC